MQGPNVPWCVGSVFFPPQLLTTDVGPLFFNPVGNPQRLLSTGQRLQPFETIVSTSTQTETFLEGCATPFVPRNLLQDHLVSDSSKNQNSQCYGNLLQGLKCSDGSVVVFFICGEGAYRIGSTVFHPGSGGNWYSIRTSQCLHDPEQPDRSVSPSLQYSIQQLSAVWADSEKGGKGLAIVAARTDYHVYFCTVSIEEDLVQFISTAEYKSQVPAAHVSWSPHVYGRAAVILESGILCLFEMKDSQINNPNGVVDLIPTATLKCASHRPSAMLASQSTGVRQNRDQEPGHHDPNSGSDLRDVAVEATENVPEKWWCCEFGWLPHTLLVVTSWEVFLVDLMEHNSTLDSSGKTKVDAKTCKRGIDLLANVGASEHSRFCLSKSGKEHIVAFGRDFSDGMYEFSVATEHHVILFDTRQPQTPILQWEHGMRHDPPSLLIMCPLSALQSFHGKEDPKDIQNGRVILAVSFGSGDIQVFCYGSRVSVLESSTGNNPKRQKVQGKEWGNATYAWDIPSRIYTPLAKVDDWRCVLSSSQGLYGHGLYLPKSGKGGQNVVGIVLLSGQSPEFPCNEGTKTFTILQLTGQCELLAQTYAASHELLDPTVAGLSSIDDKSDAEESEGLQRPRYRELKFEAFPSFLMYIRTGSILNPHFSRYSQRKGLVIDDAGCTLNPGQDQTRGGATCERSNQEIRVLNPILEKTWSTADLETQLKVLIRELSVPLNLYEVARKVLRIGLPERLSHADPGIPSDLNAHWHRGYKFPSVPSLLSSALPGPKLGDDLRGEVEPSEATVLNRLTMKRNFQETIPLPLLLELHIIDKLSTGPSPANAGECHTNQCGILVRSEYLTDTKTFFGGHKFLLAGIHRVDGLIEQLVVNNHRTGVSLSDPTQEWQENPNSDGQSDFKILLYTVQEKGFFTTGSGSVNSDLQDSLIPADKATDIIHMAIPTEEVFGHDTKAKSRTFVEGLCKKFVGKKVGFENQESRPANRYLETDPSLCPIKLCFTDPDEELEPGELTALEEMQGNFLQWQQSFSPDKTLH
ncbi:unnamed protein product [Calypogeia fissa]